MVTHINLALDWSERHQVLRKGYSWVLARVFEEGIGMRSSVCLHEVSDTAPHVLLPHCSASSQPQKNTPN